MELFKDKDSGIYHVSFVGTEGKTITRSTKAKTIEEAREVVAKARIKELELAAKAKALNGESLTAIMAGRKVSSEEALKEWVEWRSKHSAANTVRTQAIIVRQFLRETGAEAWSVNRLTDDHLDKFINPKDSKVRYAARNLRLSSLRSFIGFCSARAYIVGNPSRNVKVRLKSMTHEQKEVKRRLPVTEAQFKKLVAYETSTFWKHAFSLSYWTGLRLSDICCLEWASIEDTSITVWTQKTDTRVKIPLSEPLIGGGALAMTILEMMMESKGGRFCFPEERKIILDPDQRAKLSVYASRIFHRAGLEGKSFHCLRHSFVTRLKDAGKTLEEIGTLVGHSNTKTTEIYAH